MSLIAFEQNKRLEKQINFIIEIDKVKNVIRKSLLFDGSRFENVAEHSWTVSIMAILLKEYTNFKVDIGKVLFMLLILTREKTLISMNREPQKEYSGYWSLTRKRCSLIPGKNMKKGKQTKLNLLWCSIDYSPLPRITYVKVSPGKSIMLLMNKL